MYDSDELEITFVLGMLAACLLIVVFLAIVDNPETADIVNRCCQCCP